eukprot:COSAG06_NODE_6521_length_2896_cov_87.289954_1_plen_98_part_00
MASSHRAEAPCLVRCPRAPSQGTRHQAPGSNERGASLWGFNEALLGTAHAEHADCCMQHIVHNRSTCCYGTLGKNHLHSVPRSVQENPVADLTVLSR